MIEVKAGNYFPRVRAAASYGADESATMEIDYRNGIFRRCEIYLLFIFDRRRSR